MSGRDATTLDGFLGRRLTIAQPVEGFRAGHDSVFLAAAVPARPGDEALELGSGAGVASLCLATRVEDCRVTGIEIDRGLVARANENAERNGLASRVSFHCADVLQFDFAGSAFDHVFLNPPFHPVTGQPPADPLRARAMRDDGNALIRWTALAVGLAMPGGTVTVIMRADRLKEWCKAVSCAACVLPLSPRAGEAPKRVIAQLRPGEQGALRLLPPLVLHRSDGKPTEEAERVLRHCEALRLG